MVQVPTAHWVGWKASTISQLSPPLRVSLAPQVVPVVTKSAVLACTVAPAASSVSFQAIGPEAKPPTFVIVYLTVVEVSPIRTVPKSRSMAVGAVNCRIAGPTAVPETTTVAFCWFPVFLAVMVAALVPTVLVYIWTSTVQLDAGVTLPALPRAPVQPFLLRRKSGPPV